ncbi:unnamed protein product [Rhizoctonia solani]|uniref:Uncharacterized protein n=1 Tax=Rhizoctonia solani TaxID=456999 RepID=A0A8H2W8A4_9AGAM|nr:unnamed protein product [Rhizoctonia solani]
MHIPIAPLLLALAALQESLYDYLGYNNAADLCAVSSWFFAGSIITQVLKGLVTGVEINIQIVERQLEPLFGSWIYGSWSTPHLGHTSLFSFADPLTSPFFTIGTGAEAEYSPYATFSYDAATRPSSTVAPVYSFNTGLSASATSNYPVPSATLRTPWSISLVDETAPVSSAVPTPSVLVSATPISAPPDEWAFNSPLPTPPCVFPVHPAAMGMSVSEIAPASPPSNAGFTATDYSVAKSAPTIVATTTSLVSSTNSNSTKHQLSVEIVRPEYHRPSKLDHSWTFHHGLVIFMGMSIAIQFGLNLYLSRGRVQCSCQAHLEQLAQIRLLLEELGDIPYIVDDYDLLPSGLRTYVDLASCGRNTFVRGEGRQITAEPAKTPMSNEAESFTKVYQSAATSPIASSTDHTRTKLRAQAELYLTPRKFNDALFTPSSSPHISARVAKLSEDIRIHEQRVDQALEELIQVAGQYPRPSPMQSVPTGASSWAEIRKTARRSEANTSPLAHRVGDMAEIGLFTPDPSRGQSRTEISGAQPSMTSRLIEDSRSMIFNPVATSSPLSAPFTGLSAISYAPSHTLGMSMCPGAITESGKEKWLPAELTPYGWHFSATTSILVPSTSQSGPSLITEPLPPQNSKETSFGTNYSRSLAPEPDTSYFLSISQSRPLLLAEPLPPQTPEGMSFGTPYSCPPAPGPGTSKFPSTSRSGPLLLAGPLSPQTSKEASFGISYSRPPAPKPDTTVQSESWVAIHKREWLAERQRNRRH